MANPAKDLTGQKFGYLTVVARAGTTSGANKCATWLCRCDCGNEIVRKSQDLRSKLRLSLKHCGCKYGTEESTHGNSRHLMSNRRPYRIWHGMIQRCANPKSKDWLRYGGRGITVCERWLASFADFWADVQPGYEDQLTLGRMDNNGNYEPGNCRWETPTQQGNNTRANRILDTPAGRMTLVEAARHYGIKEVTLGARIGRYGWSMERAVTTPVKSTTSSTAARAPGSR